jgi:hypothetical protein
LSKNLGASTSWNPKDLSRPVMGLLFVFVNGVKYVGVIFDSKVTPSVNVETREVKISKAFNRFCCLFGSE